MYILAQMEFDWWKTRGGKFNETFVETSLAFNNAVQQSLEIALTII